MRTIFLTVLLLVGGAAQAVTIDFNDTLPTFFGLETYSEDGFTLTSNVPDGTLIDDDNLVRGALGTPGTGTDSQALFWGENGSDSTISIVNDLGSQFNLIRLDVSSMANAAGELTLTGTYSGGSQVSQLLTLNSSLTTYNISGFTNIVGLDISFDGSTYGSPYDVDNIKVNIVPVPAAVWLFVSALGALGWRTRSARR